MELIRLTNNTGYIPNVTNIGVIVNGTSAVLIDSGIDDDIAKKIIKCLDKEGLKIKAIINTHSHADHIGGNMYIKEKTGAKIYAPQFEASIVEFPYFEPFYLFSGAEPLKDMRNKFMMAKASDVDIIIKDERGLDICGSNLEFISLPGHSINQLGIVIEGIIFCGDAVFSSDVLNRHKIPFLIDPGAQKETLSRLEASAYKLYVPSHGKPEESISGIIGEYRTILNTVEDFSMDILNQRMTSGEFLKQLCDKFEIELKTNGQYYLMNTVANAFLSYFYNKDIIKCNFEGNLQYFIRS